ncbi:MAG: tRNA(Ile)(2)-agmatinylcytidine synthase [Thermoplasmata archaeon]
MFLAIDDTDSRKGMCTTFLITELLKEFGELELMDHPWLVRLNPNIPWKTRGNGAVVIRLGKGFEEKNLIGFHDKEIFSYTGEPMEMSGVLKRAAVVVEDWSELTEEGTNPGLIVSKEKPPLAVYQKAVRDVVELNEALNILDSMDCEYIGLGNKRGLIGALAAMAWVPRDHTYELIAYRERKRWGTERNISGIIDFDRVTEHTFDTYDHEEKQQAIAPRSPCPVLYGVRGDKPDELMNALTMIKGEPVERWLLFQTNQATDDHIQESVLEKVKPWTSVRIKGTVSSLPRTIPGGHVLFDVEQKLTAAAYEPTKGFRRIVKKLMVGDVVELLGGVRKEPLTLNIEKLRVLHLAEKKEKVANPQCPECKKRMSSVGKDAGFRCKRCGTKAGEDEVEMEKVDREISEGWYEVPVCARRHLSKPLKRVKTE